MVNPEIPKFFLIKRFLLSLKTHRNFILGTNPISQMWKKVGNRLGKLDFSGRRERTRSLGAYERVLTIKLMVWPV